MSFDLGSLVVRMVSTGRGQVEADIAATGAALGKAGKQSDALGASLAASSVKTGTFGQQVRQAGAELTYLSNEGKAAFTTIGTSVAIAGAAVAAGLGLAVAKSIEYNHAISESAAVTGAYGEELHQIRNLTLELGTRTIFNATQAADGVIQLGKAGVATSDILSGALVGALNLAAAGEVSVGDAAETAAATMVQFKLAGKDIPHIADVLTAAANKSLGGVGDLQYAMEQGATVASSFGISLEETVGTLADFASHGIIGSMAGASFKQMLLSLATPTQAQTDLMKKYNIQAYDQQGNFVGIAALADSLQKGLSGATEAQRDLTLGTLFGSRAIQAGTILYKDGAKGITDWTNKVNDAGYAAKIAALNQDNLAGDLKRLGGAFDTALIKTGDQASGVLRDLVENVTKLINGFSALDPGAQSFAVVGGGVVAVTLLLGGAFLLGVPKVLAFREAMATLRAEAATGVGVLGRTASFLTGPWGIAIAAAVISVGLFDKYLQSLKATDNELTASLTKASSAADILATATKGVDAGGSVENTAGQFKNLDDVLNAFSTSVKGNIFEVTAVKTAYGGAFGVLQRVGTQLATIAGNDLPTAQKAFSKLAAETDGSRTQLIRLLNSMPDYRQALVEQATAAGDYSETLSQTEKNTVLLNYAQGTGTTAAKEQAAELRKLSGAAEDAGGQVDDLAAKIKGFGSTSLDARSAERDFQAAIDDLTQSVHDNGTTLDINTDKGRANQAAVDQIAQSAINAAAAIYTQTGNQEQATQAIVDGRSALIDALAQFGITGQAAQDYANQLGLIPGNIDTLFTLNGVVHAQPIDDALNRWGTSLSILEDRFNTTNAAAASAAARYSAIASQKYGIRNADGNILHFAGGGFAEQHVAQLAPAGAMRVWAEPETGGEGYIPLAPSKRARSEALLSQIASMFGGAYIPGGTRRLADGAAPAGGSGSMHITGVLDLGNGLTGMIDGQISNALDHEAAARDRGYRKP